MCVMVTQVSHVLPEKPKATNFPKAEPQNKLHVGETEEIQERVLTCMDCRVQSQLNKGNIFSLLWDTK